jgi:hypothetical protein
LRHPTALTFGDMEAEVRRVCDKVIGPKDVDGRFQTNYDDPAFKAVTDFAKSMHQLVGAYFPKYRSWFEKGAERNILFRLMDEVTRWRAMAENPEQQVFCTVLMARLAQMEKDL